MAEPFVGEIRMFGGNFAPVGWLFCYGQTLSMNDPDYSVLGTLLGSAFGGDGVNTFRLPDLRGRAALGAGQGTGLTNRPLGAMGGSESVALTVDQIPSHNHTPVCSTSGGNKTSPAGDIWARQPSGVTAAYQSAAPDLDMSNMAVGAAGAGMAHDNMQPYVPISFIIAWAGVYPTP